MSIIKKGTPFGATEQVTSDKLNNLVDNASFTDTSANAVAYTGSTGTCLNGGGLEVTSAGQLQIKDSDVSTAKLADDAVTQAKTSFIDSSGVLTLTGGLPTLKFDDTSNVVTNKPFLSGNTTDGGIDIRTREGSSDVRVQAVDKFIAKTTDSPSSDNTDVNNYVDRLEASSTSGMDVNGSAVAGAKVSGSLQVTDDTTILGKLVVRAVTPELYIHDTANTDEQPLIKSYESGTIEVLSQKAASAVILDGKASVQLEVDGSDKLVASETAAKNASFVSNQPGVAVTGNLYASADLVSNGTARANAIKIGNDNILDLIHPVGSVISTTTNYADSAAVVADYGGTTWTRFSEGRMLAGYKSSDSDFSAGNEDGSKTVTLTKAQLPTDITDTNTKITFGGNAVPSFSLSGDFSFGGGPATNHQPSFGSGGTNPSKIVNLDIGGSGDSHDNMPPYKVVYMWTRTA